MRVDSVKKHRMPYFRISVYLIVIVILSVLLVLIADIMNLTKTLFTQLQTYNVMQFDTVLIVLVFITFAMAFLTVWLWRELRHAVQDFNTIELLLDQANTRLTFLNTIIREDILNQLTQLNSNLDSIWNKSEIEKIRPTINRIRRQIKFTKEYQDIGANAPEWQNVAETIMRAKVGVDLGKVNFDVEIRDVEIFADHLLEKAFYYMIDNALKHGGEKLSKIRFYGKMSENTFVIVCQDDGIGIPADKKSFLIPKVSGRPVGYGLFLIKEILAATGISIRDTGITGMGVRLEIQVPPGMYRQK